MLPAQKLLLATAALAGTTAANWPSYNRTLEGSRFAPQAQIDRANVAGLSPRCQYDTGLNTSFQTGLLEIDGTIYFATDKDSFAIDAATCALRWRSHMDYQAIGTLNVNRGLAFLDGKLFRGTQDGRVVALDAATGRQLWSRQIGITAKGETTPASPIAWNGLVFIGVAGGDNYDVQGRMYALEAISGAIRWEFDMVPANNGPDTAARRTWGNAPDVPISGGGTWTSYTLDPSTGLLYVPGGNPAPDFAEKLRPGANLFTNSVVMLDAMTGANRGHFSLVPDDAHDWDASAAPAVIKTRAGRPLLAAAVKDGHLYGFDLKSGKRLYKLPVTTIFNATAPLIATGTRFCPGTQGGNEWNGPAYSPQTNFIYTGSVDWCSTVKVADDAKVKSASVGQPWSGSGDQHVFGAMDPAGKWAGWITGTDADSGKVAWRYKTPFPVLAGVTPTAGGLLFAGDMGGNLYAFDSRVGKLLWKTSTGGALGGGIISYDAADGQRLAVASGMTSPIWPTPKSTAKVIIFGI